MIARGLHVRQGDTVPYVICCDIDMTKSFALRAHHPDDFKRDADLKIDLDYYLNVQVFPPVSRLCQYIEGTNSSFLAECLGLDSSKYRVLLERSENDNLNPISIQIPTHERFKDVKHLILSCKSCSHQWKFDGLVDLKVSFLFDF